MRLTILRPLLSPITMLCLTAILADLWKLGPPGNFVLPWKTLNPPSVLALRLNTPIHFRRPLLLASAANQLPPSSDQSQHQHLQQDCQSQTHSLQTASIRASAAFNLTSHLHFPYHPTHLHWPYHHQTHHHHLERHCPVEEKLISRSKGLFQFSPKQLAEQVTYLEAQKYYQLEVRSLCLIFFNKRI
ncbi:unnamed protein product [Protopolystoma xenopodis]|uniref:Homeobox domain-containing protein n=1 Tax=Protopolystoma xenopodis TaxID=117903 RepID=A0A3S5CNE3_9PLAT|nr:unnamed protein product [Protopolystoma xenopodis]